ncbi:MAG: hypothetical protein ACPKPY_08860 [Nitrososphaeraceae archaeon]
MPTRIRRSSTFSIFFSNLQKDQYSDKVDIGKYPSRYAKNVLVNLDVIKYGYSVTKTEKTFKCWDITKWLVENNSVIKNEIENKDKRLRPEQSIKKRIRPINHLLEKLELLKIIESKNPQVTKENKDRYEESDQTSKKKYNMKEYKFTSSGYYIVLLLQLFKERNESIYNEIYDFLKIAYNESSTSTTELFSIYIRKCKEFGHLKEYIDGQVEFLKNNSNNLHNPMQVLQNIPYLQSLESNLHWYIFESSLEELSEENFKLFFYGLKLRLENEQAKKSKIYHIFERERFRIRDMFDSIVIEGYCDNCKSYVLNNVDILFFLQTLMKTNKFTKPCMYCNKYQVDFINPKHLIIS